MSRSNGRYKEFVGSVRGMPFESLGVMVRQAEDSGAGKNQASRTSYFLGNLSEGELSEEELKRFFRWAKEEDANSVGYLLRLYLLFGLIEFEQNYGTLNGKHS